MAALKQTVMVEQAHNPKFSCEQPEHPLTNSKFVYHVKSTKNTLRVSLGQWLVAEQVNGLIADGVEVTVVEMK